MTYIFKNQNNYASVKYDRKNTAEIENIKTSGCGVCATINAISNLNKKTYLQVDMIATEYLDCGARTNNGTDVSTGLAHLKKIYGGFSYKKGSLTTLKTHLKNGGTAILCTSGGATAPKGLFSTGGHYISAVKIYEKGGKTFVEILDSGLYAGKYNAYSRNKFATVSGNVVTVEYATFSKAGITEVWLLSKDKFLSPKLTVSTKELPLRLRKKPNASAKIIKTIPKGAKVNRLGKVNNFYYIEHNKIKGFSAEAYLK